MCVCVYMGANILGKGEIVQSNLYSVHIRYVYSRKKSHDKAGGGAAGKAVI